MQNISRGVSLLVGSLCVTGHLHHEPILRDSLFPTERDGHNPRLGSIQGKEVGVTSVCSLLQTIILGHVLWLE